MSGQKAKRKITVEVGSDSNAYHDSDLQDSKKKSVFERLGNPSASYERTNSTKEKTEKCRKWQMYGTCPYGRECKYLHIDQGGVAMASGYRNDDQDNEKEEKLGKTRQKRSESFPSEAALPPKKVAVEKPRQNEKQMTKKEKKKAKIEPIVLHSKVQRPDTSIDVFKEQKHRDVRKVEVRADIKKEKHADNGGSQSNRRQQSPISPEPVIAAKPVVDPATKKHKKKKKESSKEKRSSSGSYDAALGQDEAGGRSSAEGSRSEVKTAHGDNTATYDSKKPSASHKKKKKKNQCDNSTDDEFNERRCDEVLPKPKSHGWDPASPGSGDRTAATGKRPRMPCDSEDQDGHHSKGSRKQKDSPVQQGELHDQRLLSGHGSRNEYAPGRRHSPEQRRRDPSGSPPERYGSADDAANRRYAHGRNESRSLHHGNKLGGYQDRVDRKTSDYSDSFKEGAGRAKMQNDSSRHQQRFRYSPGPAYRDNIAHEQWPQDRGHRPNERPHGAHGAPSSFGNYHQGRGRGGPRRVDHPRQTDYHTGKPHGKHRGHFQESEWKGKGGRDHRNAAPGQHRHHGDIYDHDNFDDVRDQPDFPLSGGRRDSSLTRSDEGVGKNRHNNREHKKKDNNQSKKPEERPSSGAAREDPSRHSPQAGKRRRPLPDSASDDERERTTAAKRRKIHRSDNERSDAVDAPKSRDGPRGSAIETESTKGKASRNKDDAAGRERPAKIENQPANAKPKRDRASSQGRKRSREPSEHDRRRKETQDPLACKRRRDNEPSARAASAMEDELVDGSSADSKSVASKTSPSIADGVTTALADSDVKSNDMYDNFSDSSIGEGLVTPQGEAKENVVIGDKETPENAGIDDVYESISDEDIALWEQDDLEGKTILQPAAVANVDWSLLASLSRPMEKTEEDAVAVDYRSKLSPGAIFQSAGFSPQLLSVRALEAVRRSIGDASLECSVAGKTDLNLGNQKNANGALVANVTRRLLQKKNLYKHRVGLSRAFGLRRDLACRKTMRMIPGKFSVRSNLFCGAPTSAVDSELLNASIALYRRHPRDEKFDNITIVPSRVGEVVSCR